MRTLNEVLEISQKTKNFVEIEKEGIDGFAGTLYDRATRTKLNFIASWGAGFEHVSVSIPTRCPSWEQMCLVKETFWMNAACNYIQRKKTMLITIRFVYIYGDLLMKKFQCLQA